MKVDMVGVPQSRWVHPEVHCGYTYVPPKTPRQPFPIPIIFRADPFDCLYCGFWRVIENEVVENWLVSLPVAGLLHQ